jgi:DNA-directed RNA polymerase specialized sigma24 family protein
LRADPAIEEERLLIEAAQRNPGCFAELYERNFARVYAYVARRVGSREEAEDVTAEVFQQALVNLPRFDWRGVAFGAWLRRIAANTIADRWHAARRESREPERDGGGIGAQRRRREAASMARTAEPAGSGGEGKWLSALWWTGWIELSPRRSRRNVARGWPLWTGGWVHWRAWRPTCAICRAPVSSSGSKTTWKGEHR